MRGRKKKNSHRLTFLILKRLASIAAGTADVFLPPQYPEAGFWREILGLDRAQKISRPSISSTLNRLKRQGIVLRSGNNRNAVWRLTTKGKKRLKKLEKTKRNLPPKDGIMRVIIFDIPESMRVLRTWLREELICHDCSLLQKSVWIGFRPLSEEFIKEIEEKKLKKYVHIFTVKDTGTLLS